MHVDDERIQRLLHGELAPAQEKLAREHLAECEDCEWRYAAMKEEEKEVDALLRHLDRPAPRVDIGAIARRAEARRPRLAQWAAGFALVLGLAGVAYALPGSPVPLWIDAVVGWVSGRENPLSPAGTPLELPDRSFAGIAVPPGQRLNILFTSPNANGRIVVSLTDDADVQVRSPHGAATFTAGEDLLVVEDRGHAATYEVLIPSTAPRVEIRVGERQLFLKEGTRITTAATAGRSAPYLLPMAPPSP